MSERGMRNPTGQGEALAGRPVARRRRPHPARRARRVVGAVGASGMLLMTGYMTLNGALSASAQPVQAPVTNTAVTTKSTVAAVAATPSTTPVTTSKSS